MSRVATIVLNRNLPEITNQLCEKLVRSNEGKTDLFVVEAGSEPGQLSSYCTWHADWPEAREHGLRYSRGMNYALAQLANEKRYADYDFFFLVTNDTEFPNGAVIEPLLEVMEQHPKVGVLSPCSERWGERLLLEERQTRYFWYIHNTALMLRREFIDMVRENEQPDYMNFLFDGENFRGYASESELIAKAYVNDWAAAITTHAWAEENEKHLLTRADLIQTETYEENLRLYLEEGRQWMRRKYGFNSRWSIQMYVKFLYDKFFEFHPEFESYRI